MTQDEFASKYRRQLLGFLADCFSVRKLAPSEFGMEVDRMHHEIAHMLKQMYFDLTTEKTNVQTTLPNGPPSNGPRAVGNGQDRPAAGRPAPTGNHPSH